VLNGLKALPGLDQRDVNVMNVLKRHLFEVEGFNGALVPPNLGREPELTRLAGSREPTGDFCENLVRF
jgi:hypothetical protein